MRVIQVAEAAGDTQTVIRWRSALVDAHKSQGRIGDAATGLRALMQLVPDSAEYRTRLAQLEPPAARRDAERGGPRPQPTIPVVPPLETSGKRPRPSSEMSAQRRVPVEPAAPIPPPPSFAPAPPAAGAAEGEFILEFEDDQLVHEPGSTGPVPNAVRRLSQPRMPSFPPPSAPAPGGSASRAAPSRRAARAALRKRGGADPFAVLRRPARRRSPTGPRRRVRRHARPISRSRRRCRPMSSRFAVEPASLPFEGESIELSGEPLSAVEQPATVAEAETAGEEVLAPDAIESALAEADVFRKYGLYDKAVDHLRGILKRAPDTLPLREKLFELALEGGRKNVAIAEAERLKSLYRTEGRDDRVSAIDALLVERTSTEMGEASESHPGLPAALKDTLPRARPAKEPESRGAPPAAAPVAPAEPAV